MHLNRRVLLAGASAVTISLFMPISSGVPLDRDALEFLAQRIRTTLKSWPPKDRDTLFAYILRRAHQDTPENEWLSEKHVVRATHRTLQVAFRALRIAAQEDGYNFPLMKGGKLTLYGQSVLAYLPMVPDDYKRSVFDALNRCAPHYLS